MANQLKMAAVDTILTLYGLGWSQRRIAGELGIDRETVSRHIHSPPAEAKPATNPIPGSEPAPEAILRSEAILNPIPGSAAAGLSSEDASSGPESLCEPFRVVIEAKIQQGLTGQRIYQDLVEGHGFAPSYSSVRRFLQRLGQGQPLPFRRLEVLSGEEAQVDFGTGAPILRPDGKCRRPYVFRVVLSFSRKAYSEVVFRGVVFGACSVFTARCGPHGLLTPLRSLLLECFSPFVTS